MTEFIRILSGPSSGREFPVEGLVSIGRAQDNTIVLDDVLVSRKHAEIEQTPEGAVLRNLRSAMGVYVNRRWPVTEERLLDDGDTISLGNTKIRYCSGKGKRPANALPTFLPRLVDEAEILNRERFSVELVVRNFFARSAEAAALDEQIEIQHCREAVERMTALVAEAPGQSRLFEGLMEPPFAFLPVWNSAVLGVSVETGAIEIVHSRCQEPDARILEAIVRSAIAKQEAAMARVIFDPPDFSSAQPVLQRIVCVLCVPLLLPDGTRGALYADGWSLGQHDLEFLAALADCVPCA